MRLVDFAPLSRSVSAIGFGCASLGSRVTATRGREALERAFDAGVSWFDVAPSYGDGQAEVLLGKFLEGKRSHVTLCTKVGLLPGRVSLPMRLAKPVLQRAVALIPVLRKQGAKFRPTAQPVGLTGSFIEASIVESLRRLRTDSVEVLALHDARLADVQREDVLRALDAVVSKGYARAISMAGDLEVSLAAAQLSERIHIIQFASSPFGSGVARAKQLLPGRQVRFVTHSVYRQSGSLARFSSIIAKEPGKRKLMESAGYYGTPHQISLALLLDLALASNADGVVLLSMYQPSHLKFNLGRLTSSPLPAVVLDLARQLNSGDEPPNS